MEEFEQLWLWKQYDPCVNDYVIWDKGEYGIDQGWVYFKCEEYITIETGVKRRAKADCIEGSNGKGKVLHRSVHTLLLCQQDKWCQLEYVRTRKPLQDIKHYSECDD